MAQKAMDALRRNVVRGKAKLTISAGSHTSLSLLISEEKAVANALANVAATQAGCGFPGGQNTLISCVQMPTVAARRYLACSCPRLFIPIRNNLPGLFRCRRCCYLPLFTHPPPESHTLLHYTLWLCA